MAAVSGRSIEMFNRQGERPIRQENVTAVLPNRQQAQRLGTQENTTPRETSMAAVSGRPIEMFNRQSGRPIH